MQDTSSSITASIKRFFSGTMISRATGLAREVAMAAAFGTNPAVAAFWMAYRFSHLLRRVFGEGALHSVFVPHFESLKKQDAKLGARFFYDLSMGLTLFLLFTTVLAESVLGGLLLFADLKVGTIEVLRLTMLMLPALVFICLYALNTSLLNCERSFFIPSVAPSALNCVWILALFFLWHQPTSKAMEVLAMALVFALALQWAVTLPKVLGYLKRSMGDLKSQSFSGREILLILRPFLLGLGGVAATQVNSALDTIFARLADPEGPAYLWYALRVQQLPLALFGVGLTGAILPPIARAVQGGEKEHYLHFINFALKKAALFLIPVTAALFVLGFSGLNLIYGHGAFTNNALIETTLCLWSYGIALLPMTLVLVFASAFYAHKNYRTPTLYALSMVALNMCLNALFVFVFHMGAVSVALATSAAACINTLLLARVLKARYGLNLEGVFAITTKLLIASLFAMLVTMVLGAYFVQDNTLFWLMQKEEFIFFPRQIHTQLFVFCAQAACFGVSFLVAAWLLRIQEIRSWKPRFN